MATRHKLSRCTLHLFYVYCCREEAKVNLIRGELTEPGQSTKRHWLSILRKYDGGIQKWIKTNTVIIDAMALIHQMHKIHPDSTATFGDYAKNIWQRLCQYATSYEAARVDFVVDLYDPSKPSIKPSRSAVKTPCDQLKQRLTDGINSHTPFPLWDVWKEWLKHTAFK